MRPTPSERPRKHELWFPCGRYFLRTIRREDASDRWAGWLGDPWARDVLNLAPKKMQKADIAQYIKTFDQRSRLLLGIFENGTRLHVGFVRLDIDFAANEALVNAVIGEAEHRNRGATTNVFVPILDFLFDTVGLERVKASVLDRNQVTLQYLLKMGWQIDDAAGGQIKSSTDGALLDLRTVVWTREAYRAFRLTGIGSRILRRLSAKRARPR
ncbi:hypothetical protein ES707_00794 [subsurface metagenome]|jgi:RimJ/RimL family protein N-acetyltransferase